MIFTADNGTGRSVVSEMEGGERAGEKGSPTCGGMHVLWVASWPGRIATGRIAAAARPRRKEKGKVDGPNVFRTKGRQPG